MFSWSGIFRMVLAAGMGLMLCGCLPSSNSQMDEQKDPYFIAGKAHVNSFNFKAAIEAFEKAAEANPRSASAHLELGLLYEQKSSDDNSPAIAIYHYSRYLQLRPESEHATFIREHIKNCKQELVKPLNLQPGTSPTIFRDFEKLKAENAQLNTQVEAWKAAYNQIRAGLPAPAPQPVPQQPQAVAPQAGQPRSLPPPTAIVPRSNVASTTLERPPAPVPTTRPDTSLSTTTSRKHKVASGETPASIAKKYRVPVNKLMEANPRLDERKLQIGMELNIPTP
jgi:LysM repeat protein